MKNQITVFIPFSENSINNFNFRNFNNEASVKNTFFLTNKKELAQKDNILYTNSFFSKSTLRKIVKYTDTEYLLIVTKEGRISLEKSALTKLTNAIRKTNAGLAYSNYYETEKRKKRNYQVNEYQYGSVRDNFDFGPLMFFCKNNFENQLKKIKSKILWNGIYSIQLSFSVKNKIKKANKYLYSFEELKRIKESKKHFEYLEKENAAKQKEAEKIFTLHLKKIGAYLKPRLKNIDFSSSQNNTEVSVIIPVKNRAKTIEDAIRSAQRQKLKNLFNIIVVDNHSTDRTTKIIDILAETDKRIIHIIPQKKNLCIGGCWNLAVNHKKCGKFSVQLDSDDIYNSKKTLQKIVDKFYKENCGMVVGAYQLTDFNLNRIPPGIIAHNEWTKTNGHNNALRVNGFGAPRAFVTKLLNDNPFPNISYGEDYAVCLAITRKYKVGRIYKPIYICRRWSGNTDSDISIDKKNRYDFYKDSLRTAEIKERIKINKKLK